MINLIPDWDTDGVVLILPCAWMNYYNELLAELEFFYANFLVEIAKYDTVTCIVANQASMEKMVRLTGLNEEKFDISLVEDIWIKDFAPIQSEQCYIKFIFNPQYESKLNNKYIDQSFMDYFYTSKFKDCHIDITHIDLRLEGGNFTHNGKGTAIVTEKLYTQNRNKSKEEIEKLLRDKLFIEKLVVVPTEPGDITGHIDGMLRWIDSHRIIINDYQHNEFQRPKFVNKLNESLDTNLPEVERITIPYFPSNNKSKGWFSAEGNYINFLRTRNRVYVPIYQLTEEEIVKEIFNQIFGENISFVEADALSKYGGALNCMTWNYRLPNYL
jgi:agmatine deiminase